jgi:transcription elongation factor S-II
MSHQIQPIKEPEIFRQNLQYKIGELFADMDLDKEKKQSISMNVEKGIYNFTIRESKLKKVLCKWESQLFVQIYLSRLRSVMWNLESNKELRQMLCSGEITAEILSKMTHQEFQPEQWKEMIERKTMRDASKLSDNMQASTDMFTCRKCRSKRCTYYEMQTRSADEPATVFITCLNCGKNWRQ